MTKEDINKLIENLTQGMTKENRDYTTQLIHKINIDLKSINEILERNGILEVISLIRKKRIDS